MTTPLAPTLAEIEAAYRRVSSYAGPVMFTLNASELVNLLNELHRPIRRVLVLDPMCPQGKIICSPIPTDGTA